MIRVNWIRSALLCLSVLGTVNFAMAAPQPGSGQSQAQQQTAKPPATPAKGQPAADAPKASQQEQSDYEAFYAVKPEDAGRQILLGEDFLKKYPASGYRAFVYSRLAQQYFNKGQMEQMYAAGEKALALNPDDVDVLSLVGWALPHSYNANELDAAQRLDKAEKYSRRCLELLPGVPKPPGMADDQFTLVKNQRLAHCHSGLGLVFHWKQDFAQSVPELEKATQLVPDPDLTDLYVLGFDLEQLKRYAEASAAFQKCSKTSWALQDQCKEGLAASKKLGAAQPPAKP
jgi:tetratricopeptide (TPR) repeat protein